MHGTLGFSQVDTTKTSQNSLGIRVGYNQGYFKDLNFSPLNYTEAGMLFGLTYTKLSSKEKGVLNVDLEFSSSQLKTKKSSYLVSNSTLANLEISYLRRVSSSKDLSFYIGGEYSSYVQIVDWQDFDSFSYLASHGIGVKGLLFYDLTPIHRFSTSLFIPVFQFLARPPYNGIDEEIIENQDNIAKIIFNGSPSSVGQYLALEWKINYLLSISEKVDLSATYLLRYQNLSEINKVIHLQNQLSIGANIKF